LLIGCKSSLEKKSENLLSNTAKDTIPFTQKIEIDTIQEPPIDVEKHITNYKSLKRRISNYKASHKNTSKEIISKKISGLLIDSIFPYWIGTTWDFNGYTETPLKGDIACGYFVSTTIRDVDIKINRYKIAQKGATDIIKSLCDTTSLKNFSSVKDIESYAKTLNENQLMIIGLDFHVGFIYKKNQEIYFAHSNYINNKGVMIEKLNDSEALKHSKNYIIGDFSNNETILNHWIH